MSTYSSLVELIGKSFVFRTEFFVPPFRPYYNLAIYIYIYFHIVQCWLQLESVKLSYCADPWWLGILWMIYWHELRQNRDLLHIVSNKYQSVFEIRFFWFWGNQYHCKSSDKGSIIVGKEQKGALVEEKMKTFVALKQCKQSVSALINIL